MHHALHLRLNGLQAQFVLATVQDPTYVYEMMLAPDAEVFDRVSGAVGTRALQGAEALFEAAAVPFEREIGSGDPAQTVVEIAERYACELIIMGRAAEVHCAVRCSALCRKRCCKLHLCP